MFPPFDQALTQISTCTPIPASQAALITSSLLEKKEGKEVRLLDPAKYLWSRRTRNPAYRMLRIFERNDLEIVV